MRSCSGGTTALSDYTKLLSASDVTQHGLYYCYLCPSLHGMSGFYIVCSIVCSHANSVFFKSEQLDASNRGSLI